MGGPPPRIAGKGPLRLKKRGGHAHPHGQTHEEPEDLLPLLFIHYFPFATRYGSPNLKLTASRQQSWALMSVPSFLVLARPPVTFFLVDYLTV